MKEVKADLLQRIMIALKYTETIYYTDKSLIEEIKVVLRQPDVIKSVCECTEEPCWGVGGKCVTCGLDVKQN